MRVGSKWVWLVVALVAPAGVTAQEERSVWAQKAEQLVRALEEGRFGEAEAMMAPAAREQLDSTRLANVWAQVVGGVGALKTLTLRPESMLGENHVVEFDAAFERQALLLRVVFQPDGLVAGFWLLPPGAASGSAGEGPPYADRTQFVEEEMVVGEAPWRLPATLTLPKAGESLPVLVLVHGSGPHDRDETIGPNKPFRDLAWGLATRGIAVLRYEKRTKAHAARLATLGTITVEEEVIADAVAALAVARAHERIDGNRVYLLGHSLGGMLAPEIAVRDGATAGVILLAGSNRPFGEVVAEQLTYIKSLPESAAPATQARLDAILDTVALLRAKSLPPEANVIGAPASYVYDLDQRDPLAAVKRVASPVLVLQGGRDYQVTEVDHERWRQALADRTDVQSKLYPELNHLFVAGRGKATPSEYAQAGHVAEAVVSDIAQWIGGHR